MANSFNWSQFEEAKAASKPSQASASNNNAFNWSQFQEAQPTPKRFKNAYGDEVQGGYTGLPTLNDVKQGFGKAAGVGLNIGRDIANIPYNLSGGRIPAGADPNYDYYEALGTKGGLDTDIAQGVIESAPFFKAGKALTAGSKLLSKAPNLSANVIGTSLYGAAENKENRGEGALFGGASAALGTGAQKVVDALLIKPASKFIAKQSIEPLAEKAAKALQKAKNPQEAAAEIQNLHDFAVRENKSLWSQTSAQAEKLDAIKSKLPNSAFNAKPYNEYINKFENKVLNMTPAQASKYESALDIVDEVRRVRPRNIKDVVELRQNLNEKLNEYAAKKDIKKNAEYKNFVKGLKKTFNETVDSNIPEFAKQEGELFKQSWEAANKSHAKLQQFYYKPDKYGAMKPFKGLREAIQGGAGKSESAILSLFEPKPGQTGTAGFDHLSKLIGKDKAKEAIKGYAARKISEGDPYKAVKLYDGYSPMQRKAIFGDSKEGKMLDAAHAAWSKLGKPTERHSMWHGIGSFGTAGALAGLGTWGVTGDWEKGLGAAALVGGVPYGIGKGLAKAVPLFPRSAEFLSRVGQEGRRNPGRLTSLGALWGANEYLGGKDATVSR